MIKEKLELKMIVDLLTKKNYILDMIINITLNQKIIIGDTELREIFISMNEEKQKHIDEVITIDRVFERKVKKIEYAFEDENFIKENRILVLEMQEKVKVLLEKDEKIRHIETVNRNILDKNKKNINALDAYNHMKKK